MLERKQRWQQKSQFAAITMGGHGAISPRRYKPALAKHAAWAKQPHHVYLHTNSGTVAAVAFGGIEGSIALLEQMAGPEFVGPRFA
ncbi:hypothetical protein [Cupriavidus sp. Met-2]|uniref:hypothetical protein n=1 Tax=Cupriavidus sp. Met-2 TaxID=3132825 RepID=UPI0004656E25